MLIEPIERLARLKHLVTRKMGSIVDAMDGVDVEPAEPQPMYTLDSALAIFTMLPGLWSAYCQGWADYHAYETWSETGVAVRARLHPLPSVYPGAAVNQAGWMLPPSAPFVTVAGAADLERALRRTGYMAQQVLVYLYLAVGRGRDQQLYDGPLTEKPELAFCYLRGWHDRQDTFRLDTLVGGDRSAQQQQQQQPDFVVPPGTFVGPKQYMIVPMPYEVPAAADPRRRMLVSHYVHRMPDSKIVVELGSIDEVYLEWHVDIMLVLNEEFYSRTLYNYLNVERPNLLNEFYDEHYAEDDAWPGPVVPAEQCRPGDDAAAGTPVVYEVTHPYVEETGAAAGPSGGPHYAAAGTPVVYEVTHPYVEETGAAAGTPVVYEVTHPYVEETGAADADRLRVDAAHGQQAPAASGAEPVPLSGDVHMFTMTIFGDLIKAMFL